MSCFKVFSVLAVVLGLGTVLAGHASAPAQASEAPYCSVTLNNGKVVRKALEISWEHGSPIGSGQLKLAGLDVVFESGWSGVDENGGANKSVFQLFSVYRDGELVAQQDLGETGRSFSRKLKNDAVVSDIRCQL